MKKRALFLQAINSGYIALTAYQGKMNKHVLILSTMQTNVSVADNAKKTREIVFPAIKQSMESIYLTKRRRNILAEPAHKGDQYIVFKTHWIWLLSMPGFSTKRD